MKLRFFVLALFVASLTIGAHAQGGVYLNPIVTRVGISTPDSGPFAFLGQGNTSQIFGGVVIGGYYEFLHADKIDLSADIRDSIEHGNGASFNSFLVGLRASGKPYKFSAKPYAQISLGDGRTRSPLNPIHASKFVYDISAGLDRPLNKFIEWRIVEVGYGSLTTISSQLYGAPTPIPPARLINFSTGFVFRIP